MAPVEDIFETEYPTRVEEVNKRGNKVEIRFKLSSYFSDIAKLSDEYDPEFSNKIVAKAAKDVRASGHRFDADKKTLTIIVDEKVTAAHFAKSVTPEILAVRVDQSIEANTKLQKAYLDSKEDAKRAQIKTEKAFAKAFPDAQQRDPQARYSGLGRGGPHVV